MSVIDVFPSRMMRHNDQKDNPGSHGIAAGSDCWYAAAAMAAGFIGWMSGDDQAVFRIKEEFEGDGRTSKFREFLRGAKYGDQLKLPPRLAVMGELGALFLAWKGKREGFRVVWSPGYRRLLIVEEIAKANNLPLVWHDDSDGSLLARGLHNGRPAILSTMATPSGHYLTASGVWHDSGVPGGLRIEDPYGRYPHYDHARVGDGAGNLHTWETLRKMRAGLGWRYAQLSN